MASFAEIMTGKALESAGQAGAGIADSITKGAELGLKVEQVQQQRQQIEMQKQQLQQARLAKFAEAVEKGQQYSGKAQSNYYNKFLPAFRDSLGLTQMFPNSTVEFIAASPENLGRFNTLAADVRSGHLTEQQAVAILQDPMQFGEIAPTPKQMEQIAEAAKFALQNKHDFAKQYQSQRFAQQEANQKRLEAGQVKLDTDFAPKYEDYVKDRGTMIKNMEKYQNVIAKLKNRPADETTLGVGATAVGKIPLVGKDLKVRVDQETAQLKRDAESAIQNMLKPILGAQFAAIEGEQIMQRAFDENQTNANNIRTLEQELRAVRERVQAFDEMASYYQNAEKTFGSKTLAGFQGRFGSMRPNPPPGIPADKYNALNEQDRERVWEGYAASQTKTARK